MLIRSLTIFNYRCIIFITIWLDIYLIPYSSSTSDEVQPPDF